MCELQKFVKQLKFYLKLFQSNFFKYESNNVFAQRFSGAQ